MPHSVQIDPDVLAHARREQGYTQYCISKKLDMSERGYQKIEAAGRTSPERAKKISELLNVHIDNLSGTQTLQLKTEYWMKDPVSGKHTILSSPHELINLVEAKWSEFSRFYEREDEESLCVEINFENGRYKLHSTLSAYKKGWEMEFRRVRFNEHKGLVWARESQLEEKAMSSLLIAFFRENADKIKINGETKYIDGGSFTIVIDEWKDNIWSNIAEAEYDRLGALKIKLVELLQHYSPREMKVHRSILEILNAAPNPVVMLNVWPKINSRSACYAEVVNPLRIYIVRSITHDPEVQSTWAKKSKDSLISDLIVSVPNVSGVVNSRFVDWPTELPQLQ